MIEEMTRWRLAMRSALRSLAPVLVALAAVYQEGGIRTWADVWSVKTFFAVLLAMVTKGLITAATVKDVAVRRR